MTDTRRAIAEIGSRLGPDVLAQVQAIYADEQAAFIPDQPITVADAAYGAEPRQTLDLFVPKARGETPLPTLLWLHGGGFVRGEKSSENHPYNAHIGRWAARNGMIGAVMNYRLAPAAGWPSGGDDIALALEWLRANVARHGGDPGRIVLMGTSAGAAHIATHLQHAVDANRLAGAVLLSGLYGFTPLDERDTLYFGAPELYSERMARDAVVATDVPLFVACAEYDPPRFQAETLGLLAARLERHGRMPRAYIASGHNHFSIACHLGTRDTRLANAIIDFLGEFA